MKSWVHLFALSACWGASFIFVELALQDLPPFTLVQLRLGISAVFLYGLLRLNGQRLSLNTTTTLELLVMGFLQNLLPFCLIVWGQTHITATEASALNATTPFFTVFLAHMWLANEQATSRKILGVGIGFSGALLVIAPWSQQGLSEEILGYLAVLAASCSYAFSFFWGQRMSPSPPLTKAAGMTIISSLIISPLAIWVDRPWQLEPRLPSLAAAIGLGIISTGIAYLLFFRILEDKGPTFLSLVTTFIPCFTLVFGLLLLDERLTALTLIGIPLVLIGLFLVDSRSEKIRHRVK